MNFVNQIFIFLRMMNMSLDSNLLYLRGYILSLFLLSAGSNFRVKDHVKIVRPRGVKVGDRVFLNHNCDLDASSANITIGNDIIFGMDVMILTTNHHFKSLNVPIRNQGIYGEGVTIEDDVWICARATILPGVTVQKGSVVCAGAVVTKDVPAYSIVGGVPARVIGSRLTRKIAKRKHENNKD